MNEEAGSWANQHTEGISEPGKMASTLSLLSPHYLGTPTWFLLCPHTYPSSAGIPTTGPIMTQSFPLPHQKSLFLSEDVGAVGLQVVLGPQVMSQQAHYGAQACLGTNPRKCQDLGDSILLILGSFILLNVGINVVTLLWRNLKSSLRILFHHFFPKDKPPSGVSSQPVCMYHTVDPRNLYSRITSQLHRRPSFLLGRAIHLDSWTPDTNDGKVSRPEISSQFPKTNKMDTLPHSLAQESKTKAPDCSPACASAQTNKHGLPQSQTHSAEAQDLKHTSAQAPPVNAPPPIPAPKLPCALAQAPAPSKAHISAQALAQAQCHSLAPSEVQIPALTPAPTPAQGSASAHTPDKNRTPCQADDFEQTLSQDSVRTPAHSLIHSCVSTPVHGPICAPEPSPTLAPAISPALASARVCTRTAAPVLAKVPTTTTSTAPVRAAPTSTLTPRTASAAFDPSLSAGHVVYDARRAEQNISLKHNAQNSRHSGRDLYVLSTPQEGQGPVNSGIAEKTSKQDGGDTAKPPTGPILGYLELGNVKWKMSDDAKDELSQAKTLPYCNFHPYSTERKKADFQVSVYPKILVYGQDAAPSKACFHSPSTAHSSPCTLHPPCPLSLPLALPRTIVHPQSNHQKPSNLTQSSPIFLPTCKSPLPVPTSCFPRSSQFPTISQPLTQLQQPESQGLMQEFDLQRTPCLSNDFRFAKNPGLTPNPGRIQNPDIYKNPGLNENPSLCMNLSPFHDSGLHRNPDITQGFGPPSSSGAAQDAGVFKNPGLTQHSDLHKNPLSTQTADQKSLGFMQNSGIYRNVELNQDSEVCRSHDLSRTTDQKRPGLSQDSGGCTNIGNAQYPGVCRTWGHTQDSEVNKSSRLTQESSPHKSQISCIYKVSGLTQESGDYKNLDFTQDSGILKVVYLPQDPDCHKGPGMIQVTEVEKRLNLTQNVGICRSSEHKQDPNLDKCSGINQNIGPHKDSTLAQGLPKTRDHTQEADLHKKVSPAPGTDSAQVLDPLQTLKPTSSPVKACVNKMAFQKEDAKRVSWASVPISQTSCPAKAQVIATDQRAFSKVPVLAELQSFSQQEGSQDGLVSPVDTVPSPCQNYRQISMPPKINCRRPGPGFRARHVLPDAHQRRLIMGRDRCEALSPRRLCQGAAAIQGRPSRSGDIKL